MEKITRFVEEMEKLMRLRNDTIRLKIVEGNKYYNVREEYEGMSESEKSLNYIRISKDTLDVYTSTGKKSRGNLNNEYGGLDLVNKEGIILVKCKHEKRIQELCSKVHLI
ncbi:Hypothetical protein ORPV_332 [Orpheovirus IHUMI-LCC2]|uniref:Uncharacterized protein n=1 Tax=Orpheovirus IHUMI-LCC2 TaxID=2023057 RepID=A0A2I2L3X3_9VIRU|nr:Hypothetical protein ORPV_332 [Orpheovirus IHUMI-LCC2]SNW62236.1 Hypothetical protein ORPV_332 [Orpheovirus IHUMI-LCC2]